MLIERFRPVTPPQAHPGIAHNGKYIIALFWGHMSAKSSRKSACRSPDTAFWEITPVKFPSRKDYSS